MGQPKTASCTVRLKLEGSKLTINAFDGFACDVSPVYIERSLLLKDLVETASAADGAEIPISQDALRLWMQHVDRQGQPEKERKRPRQCLAFTTGGSSDQARSTALPSRNMDTRGAVFGTQTPYENVSVAERLCHLLNVRAPLDFERACDVGTPWHSKKVVGAAVHYQHRSLATCRSVVQAANVLIDESTKNSTAAQLATYLQLPQSGPDDTLQVLPAYYSWRTPSCSLPPWHPCQAIML